MYAAKAPAGTALAFRFSIRHVTNLQSLSNRRFSSCSYSQLLGKNAEITRRRIFKDRLSTRELKVIPEIRYHLTNRRRVQINPDGICIGDGIRRDAYLGSYQRCAIGKRGIRGIRVDHEKPIHSNPVGSFINYLKNGIRSFGHNFKSVGVIIEVPKTRQLFIQIVVHNDSPLPISERSVGIDVKPITENVWYDGHREFSACSTHHDGL